MTKLTPERHIKRETWVTDRKRPIVAELFPFFIRVSVKGTRESYDIPWENLLDRARILDARAKIAEKERKRA